MLKTVLIEKTARGAAYVNGILMRTRKQPGTGSNLRSSFWRIVESQAGDLGFDLSEVNEFKAQIVVSDAEIDGGIKFFADGEYFSDSVYTYYRRASDNLIFYFPCKRWFKRLSGWTDNTPPKELWVKIIPIA